MFKRIIVLSDGTGNSAAKVWRTNVWRTFEALDLSGSDQVAFYDDGVGTSSFKPLAILGGAFGYGLKRNVIELYKFLCRNYKSATENRNLYGNDCADDEIFAFGFSRGAFTIRVLMGLVLDQGLVKADTEARLNSLALDAYRNYRARHFHTKTRNEQPFRAIRDWLLRRSPSLFIPGARTVNTIRFLGLWDTVAAYGLPVDEMTRGVSRYLWPLELPNHRIDPGRILRACHALSLDDQRTTFHPILWDESNLPTAPNPPKPYLTRDEKVTQIWFAGVHANVGGGYPDDSLAHLPMVWIWKEAKDCKLKFKASPTSDPDALLNAQSKTDKDGRLYDSRSGLAGYYRYGPRSVHDLCNVKSPDPLDCVSIERPKIHESVFQRLAIGAHCYAPVGLPPEYDVVKYNEKMGVHEIVSIEAPFREDPVAALTRYKDQEQIVWSTVWRGRGMYFLTVLASLGLAIYPIASPVPKIDEYTTRLRFISDSIRLLANPLPSIADRWKDAYAGDPALFLISVITIGILISLSAGLRRRITDQMRHLLATSLQRPNNLQDTAGVNSEWRPVSAFDFAAVSLMIFAAVVGLIINPLSIRPQWLWTPLVDFLGEISRLTGFVALAALILLFVPSSAVFTLRTSQRYKDALQSLRMQWAPMFFAASFLVLGLVFADHYVFNIRDGFGAFCTETNATPIEHVCHEADDPEKCAVSPTGGGTCQDRDGKSVPCTGRYKLVDTRELCTATGIKISQRQSYRVLVSKAGQEDIKNHPEFQVTDLDWRFAWIDSDLGGKTVSDLGKIDEGACSLLNLNSFIALSLRKVCNYVLAKSLELFGIFAYPLKRTFDRPFGRFVLRYGSTGNEENPIDAAEGAEKLNEKFTPTKDGELFVYLNEPAFGLWANAFHDLNGGIAKVAVVRIR